MSVLFSPKGGIAAKIIVALSQAKATIDMAAYEFTNTTISNELAAVAKSVVERILMDTSCTIGPQLTIKKALLKAGAKVKLYTPQNGIQHNKFIIIDGHLFETGSYNYTLHAELYNCENAIFPNNPIYDLPYQTEFNRMWALAKVNPIKIPRRTER